jgi:hypothetical protein
MSTELCDFVKLVLDRMDTNPEEFIEGDPKHRWGSLSRGIVDWVMGETDTSSARALWALEPHEREVLTTKYKAIYLEKEKRAFLKNILGAGEPQAKKAQVIRKSIDTNRPLTASQITNEALAILKEEWSNSRLGQNALLGKDVLQVGNGGILAGYTDARALYANEQTAKVVKRQNEPDNN